MKSNTPQWPKWLPVKNSQETKKITVVSLWSWLDCSGIGPEIGNMVYTDGLPFAPTALNHKIIRRTVQRPLDACHKQVDLDCTPNCVTWRGELDVYDSIGMWYNVPINSNVIAYRCQYLHTQPDSFKPSKTKPGIRNHARHHRLENTGQYRTCW